MAAGFALAAKRRSLKFNSYALLSDGELDEGSNWEAILFAPHHNLDNLTCIIDYNKLQSLTTVKETLNLEPLKDKLISFGWDIFDIDGHNHIDIQNALTAKPINQNLLLQTQLKAKVLALWKMKLYGITEVQMKKSFLKGLKELEE